MTGHTDQFGFSLAPANLHTIIKRLVTGIGGNVLTMPLTGKYDESPHQCRKNHHHDIISTFQLLHGALLKLHP